MDCIGHHSSEGGRGRGREEGGIGGRGREEGGRGRGRDRGISIESTCSILY